MVMVEKELMLASVKEAVCCSLPSLSSPVSHYWPSSVCVSQLPCASSFYSPPALHENERGGTLPILSLSEEPAEDVLLKLSVQRSLSQPLHLEQPQRPRKPRLQEPHSC